MLLNQPAGFQRSLLQDHMLLIRTVRIAGKIRRIGLMDRHLNNVGEEAPQSIPAFLGKAFAAG